MQRIDKAERLEIYNIHQDDKTLYIYLNGQYAGEQESNMSGGSGPVGQPFELALEEPEHYNIAIYDENNPIRNNLRWEGRVKGNEGGTRRLDVQ